MLRRQNSLIIAGFRGYEPAAQAGQRVSPLDFLFAFSILYLFVLFAMLLIDRISGGLSGHFAA